MENKEVKKGYKVRLPIYGKENPCGKQCQERSAFCHGSCEKYLKWKKEHDVLMAKAWKQKGKETMRV